MTIELHVSPRNEGHMRSMATLWTDHNAMYLANSAYAVIDTGPFVIVADFATPDDEIWQIDDDSKQVLGWENNPLKVELTFSELADSETYEEWNEE